MRRGQETQSLPGRVIRRDPRRGTATVTRRGEETRSLTRRVISTTGAILADDRGCDRYPSWSRDPILNTPRHLDDRRPPSFSRTRARRATPRRARAVRRVASRFVVFSRSRFASRHFASLERAFRLRFLLGRESSLFVILTSVLSPFPSRFASCVIFRHSCEHFLLLFSLPFFLSRFVSLSFARVFPLPSLDPSRPSARGGGAPRATAREDEQSDGSCAARALGGRGEERRGEERRGEESRAERSVRLERRHRGVRRWTMWRVAPRLAPRPSPRRRSSPLA